MCGGYVLVFKYVISTREDVMMCMCVCARAHCAEYVCMCVCMSGKDSDGILPKMMKLTCLEITSSRESRFHFALLAFQGK